MLAKKSFKKIADYFKFYIYRKIKYADHKLSFSQEGEDMVLAKIFESKDYGYYVDVGAHHPTKFSNTYHFYLRGWQGINIDAMPGSMVPFNKVRPRDINIECGISNSETELIYYIFNEPALNSFSKELSLSRHEDFSNPYSIKEERKIKTFTLTQILDKYLPENQYIDFLSIDAEGHDLEVIKSNNWERYRPKFVLVEDLVGASFDGDHQSDLQKYMRSIQYSLFSKTYYTLFFKDNHL